MLKIDDIRQMVRKQVSNSLAPHQVAVRKSAGAVDETGAGDIPTGLSLSKYLRGGIYGRWDGAEREYDAFCKMQKMEKALVGSTGTAGGFLITPEHANELIELLRAKAIIRQMGPTIYNMNSDTLNISRQTGGSTAYWISDTDSITESNQTFGNAQLVVKECAALTTIHNDLLMDASPAVDDIVRQDLVRVLGLAEDLAFIQGTGGNQPLGVYNDPGVSTTTLGSGNGAAPTMDNLMDAQYAIEASNATYNAWLMHPRTKNTIRQLKDGNGRYIWERPMTAGEPGMLLGLPTYFSTQVPITLAFGTSGSVCSYIILGDWTQFIVGQRMSIQIDATTERYFEYNKVGLRAILRVDCIVRQPSSFYIMKGVTT